MVPTLINLDEPTETRTFESGRFEVFLFHIPPGHDSWVAGDEPYVSLHVMGSETYAST